MLREGSWYLTDYCLLMTQCCCSLQKMKVTQNLVSVFDSVCKRRKLKVNINKSNAMVCERSRSKVVYFVCPYRVGIECEKECKIILNGEEMKEVNEFKYLRSVMCKKGGTERDKRKGIARKEKGW